MSLSKINGAVQIRSGTLTRSLLNTTTAGSAVVAKIIAGNGVTLASSGVDPGTGDVTINYAASRKAVNDANYPVVATDQIVAIVSITAPRVISLISASLFPTSSRLLVVDQSGNLSSTITATIQPNSADLINGAGSFVLKNPNSFVELISNVTNWIVTDSFVPTLFASPAMVQAGTDTTLPVNAAGVAAAISLVGGGGGTASNGGRRILTRGQVVAALSR